MCQLPLRKPNIEKKKPKSQTIFLAPTASKKAKFVGVKKANLATLLPEIRDDNGAGVPELTSAGIGIFGRSSNRSRSQYFKFEQERSRSQHSGLCKSQSNILRYLSKFLQLCLFSNWMEWIGTCLLTSIVKYHKCVTLRRRTEHFTTIDGFRRWWLCKIQVCKQ